MEGPPLGPGGEDITWPDQVAPRSRKASSSRSFKPPTSNLHFSELWGLWSPYDVAQRVLPPSALQMCV